MLRFRAAVLSGGSKNVVRLSTAQLAKHLLPEPHWGEAGDSHEVGADGGGCLTDHGHGQCVRTAGKVHTVYIYKPNEKSIWPDLKSVTLQKSGI